MADTRPDLVIYGSPVSPFVRKVAGVCIAKGVDYEVEAVNVFDPPQWFRDISPMKRIPVLRDRSVAADGVAGTIADSSAICAFIEKKHPAPALYPEAAMALGEALFIEEYADTALAMAGGLGIFRPIFFAISKGQAPDLDKARDAWANQLPPVFDVLEARLAGRDFFAGDALSIADIAVATVLMQVSLVAETPLDRWPALAAHFAAMQALPLIAGPYAAAETIIRKALPTRFDLT
ncbi:glutathione S-transferase family protein [Porphyrobacter sp. TH134]|uniref:glutathione S-transferase family protein n=1 Tax=Porphyrobacter sp. TH134 TaxID=2067450 RepID=UPI000C7B5DC5|nr:glutathione S-transferase family protein [Porphyrobacter sp. TH134]PLK24201.1 glutathione S-transferase family protein [Porphyrobacter sp. TH134]